MKLTILMPCLNEAETLAVCVRKAKASIERLGIRGEVLIADNGSTDGSQQIAEREGARVVPVAAKGYGNALRGGIEAAYGEYIIMGDADDSYDFSAIDPFVRELDKGFDLVMGCRMPRGGGTVMPGAMPWKHYWIGNPVLTFIGRLFFKCPAHDFHCGLRGFTKEAYRKMELHTTGMEFASEMVIKATLNGLKIGEVPITLHPDGRSRPPHLRSWRDGWRHLRFMLLFSPRWLFLVPGILLTLLGVTGLLSLAVTNWVWRGISLDAGTQAVCAMSFIVGVQLMFFGLLARAFAASRGLMPPDRAVNRVFAMFSLERGIILGLLVGLCGVGILVWSFLLWKESGFGRLSYSENLGRILPAMTFIVTGVQIIFGSFFMSLLDIDTKE